MGAEKLDTVRKLLAKAEGAATQAEAETYTAKAMELMARHGIDSALLAAATPNSDEIGAVRIAMDDPYSAGKARLLAWTAGALRCRAVMHDMYSGKVAAVTIFGFASDRERAEMLYTSLLLQACAQLVRQRPPWPGESVAAYRRSWLHGFACEVHRRLIAAEERAAEQATTPTPTAGVGSVALVLADRSRRVDHAYAEAFPHLGPARSVTMSGSGFASGAVAGRRADLGRGAVAQRSPRALGA